MSRAIHRDLRPGALLSVGLPRNNFPLLPLPRYLFVVGGIGITPLPPMMREASRLGFAWSLLFYAQSGLTLTVPTSCEQDIRGTCECRVLDGEVDHRDSILSASAQAVNQTMMVCVSRAKSARVVLDL